MTKLWEQNKHIIRAFYVDQKKTLKETKRMMEEQHKFSASYAYIPDPLSLADCSLTPLGRRIRAYRSRIKAWGWTKYNKKEKGPPAAQAPPHAEPWQPGPSQPGPAQPLYAASHPMTPIPSDEGFVGTASGFVYYGASSRKSQQSVGQQGAGQPNAYHTNPYGSGPPFPAVQNPGTYHAAVPNYARRVHDQRHPRAIQPAPAYQHPRQVDAAPAIAPPDLRSPVSPMLLSPNNDRSTDFNNMRSAYHQGQPESSNGNGNGGQPFPSGADHSSAAEFDRSHAYYPWFHPHQPESAMDNQYASPESQGGYQNGRR